jgi:hypothetical protein
MTALPVMWTHTTTPVTAFSAYTLLSLEPTYTTPSLAIGEDVMLPPVANIQSTVPLVRFMAYTSPSEELEYMIVPSTKGAGRSVFGISSQLGPL